MTSGGSASSRGSLRGALSFLFACLLALVAVAPVTAYNGVNEFHIRLSQPQHADCGAPTPLVATVTDKKGDPQAGVVVSFIKHQGSSDETLAPTSDVTDPNGNAESTYTIPCGSEPGARVIKACEPAGACATTVIDCRQGDGCTGTGSAGVGLIVPAAASRDSTILATAPTEPLLVATRTPLPPLLNVLGFALVGLLAGGMILRRPRAFRPATPV